VAWVVIILFLAAAFAVVTLLLTLYVRRVADVALTDQFRAGEAIANGRVPDKWVLQIKRRIAWRSRLPIFRRDVSGTELALAKIDKLYRFYENSPFYETAEAREMLLTQLRETRERWAIMVWEELVADDDGESRPNFEEG